jgi:hypothetical protein
LDVIPDDTNDKIRRNLVIASATIIVCAALEIPFDAIIRKVADLQGNPIAADRVLAVGFAILAYLAARFRFSQDGEELQEAHKAAVRPMVDRMLDDLANRAAREYSRNGRASGTLASEEVGKIEQRIADMANRNDSYREHRPMLHIKHVTVEDGDVPWCRSYASTLTWPGDTEGSARGACDGPRIRFVPSVRVRALIQSVCWVRAVSYSRVAIVMRLPVVFGTVATGILLWKLIAAFCAAT